METNIVKKEMMGETLSFLENLSLGFAKIFQKRQVSEIKQSICRETFKDHFSAVEVPHMELNARIFGENGFARTISRNGGKDAIVCIPTENGYTIAAKGLRLSSTKTLDTSKLYFSKRYSFAQLNTVVQLFYALSNAEQFDMVLKKVVKVV